MIPHGAALLRDPVLNKGTAFTPAERLALGLRGLLPPHVSTQAEQAQRVVENFRGKSSPLEKYIDLAALHDRNETLFFRVLADHLGRCCPSSTRRPWGWRRSATPTSSSGRAACSSPPLTAVTWREALANWPERDVRMIVVTDGERILGLGDLGADGMGIPIGKLAIYTACGGGHPAGPLPAGHARRRHQQPATARRSALHRPAPAPPHAGRPTTRSSRSSSTAVAAGVPAAPSPVRGLRQPQRVPAARALSRPQVCTFNDDIQGTAAVALAGLLSALRMTGGALTRAAPAVPRRGRSGDGHRRPRRVGAWSPKACRETEARRALLVRRLQGPGRAEPRPTSPITSCPYAHDHASAPRPESLPFGRCSPTALIGVSAIAGASPQVIVERWPGSTSGRSSSRCPTRRRRRSARPTRPTRGSDGRALFASGSPFAGDLGGRTFVPRQGNNGYIFPGVGLGVLAGGRTRITDAMFLAAARALAHSVSEEDLDCGAIFPSLTMMRDVSVEVAVAVAEVAYRQGHATVARPTNLRAFVSAAMWDPAYPVYVPDASPHPAGARHSP